jgi:hypothetical protein
VPRDRQPLEVPVIDRANLFVALISAIIGATALTMALNSGRLVSLGSVLGIVLLLNAVVRYQLARQH